MVYLDSKSVGLPVYFLLEKILSKLKKKCEFYCQSRRLGISVCEDCVIWMNVGGQECQFLATMGTRLIFHGC